MQRIVERVGQAPASPPARQICSTAARIVGTVSVFRDRLEAMGRNGACTRRLVPHDEEIRVTASTVVVIALTTVWTGMAALAKRRAVVSPRVQRIALAAATAITAAIVTWMFWSQPRPQGSDLGQVWAGARALVHGESPYDVIGPGRAFDWPFPLLYPVTAAVTLMPLAALPMRVVDPVFVGLGFGLFAYAVTRRGLRAPALAALVSLGGLMTLQTSQWSVLLTAAALLPGLGWLLVAKPTIGLALFAAFPRWRTAIACGGFIAFTLILWPDWLFDWRATFAAAPHVVAPVTRWGGPLLLLALAKWKRADARLLLGLACVPHTTAPYETIPLFLIAETWPQAWAVAALGLLAYVGQWASGPYATQQAYWASGAQWIVALLYLPCLGLVLTRPNVWSSSYSDSHLDDVDQLLDRGRRFLEGRVFVGRELDLHDLLETARPQLARHADEQVAHAVLALQINGARNDLLLVEQNRFDHVDDRGARRIPGAGSHELRDLRAAVRRPIDDRLDRR
jgi:hypothetical protein